MSDLPSWLRGFRRHMNWTQRDLGAAIQVHRVSVARWEAGSTYPDLQTRLHLNELARNEGFPAITPRWRT